MNIMLLSNRVLNEICFPESKNTIYLNKSDFGDLRSFSTFVAQNDFLFIKNWLKFHNFYILYLFIVIAIYFISIHGQLFNYMINKISGNMLGS